jgi:hypothetical protein
MKQTNCLFRIFRDLFLILLLALLVSVVLLSPPMAMAQNSGFQVYQPNFYWTDTNAGPVTLTNGQAIRFPNGPNSLTNNNGTALLVTAPQQRGLSVFVTVISSNSVGGPLNLGWDVTPDNNTFTTKEPLQFSVPTAANATGTLVTNTYWTNWSVATFNNVRSIQLSTATNGLVGGGPTTNSVTFWWTYSWENQ